MTKDWYIQHGYKMSAYIEQADIDKAEAEVKTAYVEPIDASATAPESVVVDVVANLTFLLLLQRSITLTRAGAKIKTGYNSQEADAWTKLLQATTSCHLALETLRKQAGVVANAAVIDICRIYWKSNFYAF